MVILSYNLISINGAASLSGSFGKTQRLLARVFGFDSRKVKADISNQQEMEQRTIAVFVKMAGYYSRLSKMPAILPPFPVTELLSCL